MTGLTGGQTAAMKRAAPEQKSHPNGTADAHEYQIPPGILEAVFHENGRIRVVRNDHRYPLKSRGAEMRASSRAVRATTVPSAACS